MSCATVLGWEWTGEEIRREERRGKKGKQRGREEKKGKEMKGRESWAERGATRPADWH